MFFIMLVSIAKAMWKIYLLRIGRAKHIINKNLAKNCPYYTKRLKKIEREDTDTMRRHGSLTPSIFLEIRRGIRALFAF